MLFLCGEWSGGFLVGKLRPDTFPVVRAQVFARDLSVGGLLDGGAALDRYRAYAGAPLADKHGADFEFCSQTCSRLSGIQEVIV